MYEFTREENTKIMSAAIDSIMESIIMEKYERYDSVFDFLIKLYDIEEIDYEYTAAMKTAITLNLAPLFFKLVETGSTYTNAKGLVEETLHAFICNWFRKHDIDVYRFF